MASRVISSWGNVVRGEHEVLALRSRFDAFPDGPPGATLLPFGSGLSYGDSCLNLGGALIHTRSLDRFIRFDREAGVLECESGVRLSDILRIAVPAGWMLPVVPGTQFVTVGGAIANDVHGKNHHRVGTFGGHVRSFELLRSNGERLRCSACENAQMFAATLGGLGLTGLITSAELQLRRIPSAWLEVESTRLPNVEAFFDRIDAADRDFEYTVAWVDCLAKGRQLGRGILQSARYASAAPVDAHEPRGGWGIPVQPPVSLVNAASLRLFNTMHFHAHPAHRVSARVHQSKFFFPLDRVRHWNRLYGPRGFYQYQCVVPEPVARDSTVLLLETIVASGLGSFLAVLKRFGEPASPGMLSFPMPGVTLALDFPNTGERLARSLAQLDAIVLEAGGRLYPAKDGRMPATLFRHGYPRWQEFSRFLDPRCSSTFWRRVAGRP